MFAFTSAVWREALARPAGGGGGGGGRERPFADRKSQKYESNAEVGFLTLSSSPPPDTHTHTELSHHVDESPPPNRKLDPRKYGMVPTTAEAAEQKAARV